MNDSQRAKLAMLQTTLAVLDEHADLFATNQALGKARQELAALVADLDPTADRQQRAATPEQPAAVKKATKQTLAQRAAEVAAALLALADELNDIRLHTDSDYTERQLTRKSDVDLLRIAQNLHQHATQHATALAGQGVLPQELTDLQAAIRTFQQEQTTPRVLRADGKAQKAEINADLRQATALLRNRIDKFLIRYQRPQPKFHTAYESARKVINTAARHEKPAGQPKPAQA
ncbi:hypothetical protein SAMN02745146_3693 [Hymenobacter daecheongensis DSM 21074]|uniref:Uncharacterized protein n=1 Tax=Hymenobacter daecheongensis DSM 21074 TaxID=1121955 RepID=A0A1M6LB29_9BACT|nr:hypothetical protein [Hymenobacter daecheongensis]SHJ68388.1 hypothetical protein SAMN02745146_3693 [Hymenobacter daecheongensis DSM 21074]